MLEGWICGSWDWYRDPSGPVEVAELRSLLQLCQRLVLVPGDDKVVWGLESSGVFSVRSLRSHLVKNSYSQPEYVFDWNNLIPKKVGFVAWRAVLGRLPTFDALAKRNIPVRSTLCPICGEAEETVEHVFVSCGMAQTMWTLVAQWCKMPDPSSDLVIPQVNASCKPEKGMVFESVDHAYDFYCEYAKKAGFCVRKGGSYMNEGLLKSKYFTCSKEGHKPANSYDSMAEKGHNHEMVHANDMHFVRSNRKLTHVQQDIIYEMSTLNLGPVKAFNIYEDKYDAEMVAQRISGKKNCCDGYSFEYTVNTNGELDRLFWADNISKKNYLAFGDIISFDATFKTNLFRYNMVFVQFTAIYNHCRNVIVGVALLLSESIWLLKVFLDSFGIAPKVVVTDQDPAIKQAISLALPNSRHRLCMWHIMKKLADKNVL
ncbi:protein FAR1-RELATED SEQUENCE 5-like [Bidens hawaiensis]|uniref:protein FAR1-RELATED SEQUENCE 5-like n=1 Tax=Bidens hawaiensis TaxID=980011 RepID=UPI00404B40B0